MLLAAAFVVAAPFLVTHAGEGEGAFSPWVDDNGNMTMPKDLRAKFFHLGTYVVADEKSESHGFHDVYTQASTIHHYRKNEEFPDGAVLVKELRKMDTVKMTTGKSSHATELIGWFIMVKDAKGRFKDNPHWGDGWGWGLYMKDDPKKNVSKGYKKSCRGCHIPAKVDDWIYIEGYPALAAR